MDAALTATRYIPVPESQAAWLAVQDLAARVVSRKKFDSLNPLFLHGPAGVGKTLLVQSFVQEVLRRSPRSVVNVVAAAELPSWLAGGNETYSTPDRDCDVLAIEDLQFWRSRGDDLPLAALVDRCRAEGRALILTAAVGPAELEGLSNRLVSRLAAGLVVGLLPLQAPSRHALLVALAQRRQLAVGGPILAWLAEHLLGGGRQLEGAIAQLESLARVHRGPLDLATVQRQFQPLADASRPTVEGIVQRVGDYFRVDVRQLRSLERSQSVLLPRQVSMYLARQFTDLSLAQIGSYFGGRDHSTVLHACRKIERALGRDATVSGAVRELAAALE